MGRADRPLGRAVGPETAEVMDVMLEATTMVLCDQPSSALMAGRKMPKTNPPVPGANEQADERHTDDVPTVVWLP